MGFRNGKRSTTVALLAALPMFTECDERDLRLIDRAGTHLDVAAGRVLCRQGEVGDECFIVLFGHAYVTIDHRRVCTVGRGACIGEIALLSPSRRRVATVSAAAPMSLFVLGRREFTCFRTTPGIPERLLYGISERLTDDLELLRSDSDWPSPTFAAARTSGIRARPSGALCRLNGVTPNLPFGRHF